MMQELLKEFSDTLRILNELSSSPYGLLLCIFGKGILLMVEPALVESNFNGNFTHSIFSNSKSIPTIGTLAVRISYLGVPITSPITLRYPQYYIHILVSGWLLCIFGLVLASFATQTWHLILTQGAMYSIGWAIYYTPFLIMLNN